MTDQIEWVALSVFIFFFALVTVMGFLAARWKSGPVSEHLDECGEVSYSFYVGLGALILNTLVAAMVTAVMAWISPTADRGVTAGS